MRSGNVQFNTYLIKIHKIGTYYAINKSKLFKERGHNIVSLYYNTSEGLLQFRISW